jgi:hypothetical protein
LNFITIKTAVAKQFDRMQKFPLYRVAIERDTIWETYLSSFPAGTNELYRERTEHDCACCRNFVKNIGNVVAMIDGKLESVWDVIVSDEPGYQAVVNALSAQVKAASIANTFLHFENSAGSKPNFEQLTTGGVKTWDHFFVNIQSKFVMKGADIPSAMAIPRTAHDTLLRALETISMESIDTVLDLMSQGSLYRGDDHKFAVNAFSKLKKEYSKIKTTAEKDLFAWTRIEGTAGSITGIRNTSIGTLLVDLSEGKDLEQAVASFEAMVAPQNYKRPTALVSKAMIEKAKVTITELGLTSALERRFATINDITINNILFANRDARKVINGDVFDDLVAVTTTKVKNLDKIEEVTIEKFLSDILPRAESIEVLLENRQANNLVSLIAPVDPTAGNLFKWDNRFSWSYNGNMADSIKERVKAAGGSVIGDLCCRLAWDYTDDLDFHMREPDGTHIFFANRASLSGGKLDVDANGGNGMMANPVENIFYTDKKKMKPGIYTLSVNNYNRRSDGIGFEVEIEFGGQRFNMVYDKAIKTSNNVAVAKIKYSKEAGFEIIESLPTSTTSKMNWGLPSQTFHKVNVVMMSPNFWDDKGVGNKHYFFMLDGCINDGTARGFFNEFLKDEMTPHRKVLEIVGGKMRVADSDQQLSGLGFSSTKKDTLTCRVKGSFSRTIKIVF